MNYLSTKEIAKKWQISERRIRVLLSEGRIPGAIFEKNKWLIPEDIEKPVKRNSDAKFKQQPIQINDDEYGNGRFGKYGGCYLPVGFKKMLEPVLLEFKKAYNSSAFLKKLNYYRDNLILRPTPLYYAEKFSSSLGTINLYIKREDLNCCHSIYINETLPLALIAKNLGKKGIITQVGDENYAYAVAFAANLVGLKSMIYISKEDYEKQVNIQKKITLLGSDIFIITEKIKDILIMQM